MSTNATAKRRSSLARRADAGTVAAYLRERSSRAAPSARPAGPRSPTSPGSRHSGAKGPERAVPDRTSRR